MPNHYSDEEKKTTNQKPKLQSGFGYTNHWADLSAVGGLSTTHFPPFSISWLANFCENVFFFFFS